jgi:hypothetical protein
MSRQQHELAVTTEQGMLERHFDTNTLGSQVSTSSSGAATWAECMPIARDPFANKRAVEQRLVCSLVVEEIHVSGRLSCAACDRVAINDVIAFFHFG